MHTHPHLTCAHGFRLKSKEEEEATAYTKQPLDCQTPVNINKHAQACLLTHTHV